MKRLTLIRHAKSSWKDLDLADFDRPLNGRGKRDAPEMGRRLEAREFRPDVILTSPAKRARKTARALAAELSVSPELVEDPRIYGAAWDELLEIVNGLPEAADNVAIIGHNPGMTDFLNVLSDADVTNMPTCGVAHLEIEVDTWSAVAAGRAKLLLFDYPKKRPG